MFRDTPLKTNMTLENPHVQSKYSTSLNGGFSIVMLVFAGVGMFPRNLQRSDPRVTDPEKTSVSSSSIGTLLNGVRW